MRLKCGNNATSASEGLACCLYPSGQPWEWMTAPSVLVGHQGLPFHTMNLWLHFGCTCIFRLYHCNAVNGYSDHFSIRFSSLLFNDLAASPLKPQSSKYLQTPLTFQQQLQGCDPWDELGRQTTGERFMASLFASPGRFSPENSAFPGDKCLSRQCLHHKIFYNIFI